MKRVKLFLTTLLAMPSLSLFSQDLPFSQFLVNPVYTNPALIGDVENDFRLISNYKNQWRSISDAFKTVSLTYDMAFYQDLLSEKYLGMGVSFFSDQAGLTGLNLNLYSLSLSYHTKTDRYNSIGMGISGNYGRRRIDLSQVKWESQFNGNNYDPSIASGEGQLSERFGYWDLSAGFMWNYKDPNLGTELEVGFSALHLNQPRQSFSDLGNERLRRNYQLFTQAEINAGLYNVLPRLIISRQQNVLSFILGGLIKLNADESNESKYTDFNVNSNLSFGAFYRYRDAIILQTVYDYKRTLSVGLSYDITLSKLRNYNNSLGGFEISLIYQGSYSNDKIKVKRKGVKEKDRINLRKDDRSL